ncbi:endolytic transglycosylase MltG [Actinoplanes sp. LDG1-06]|uniref:Endolytic murein transglycosylase n=1 Tax=Paractinoplanes ovalisporus TaxID=2810368 RepID=A0ABS2AV05_9ACTN|nr:endolytic transglycosylase MltG [Actinoplanes ovalisporus]MBM2623713.1 endolytic transglycosylase MltG [Actinoplanes ovalisporus]
MIDELDLAFDEHADKTKPRHRRGRGGKKSTGKSGIAFVMAFVLLAALGGGVYFGYNKVKGFFTAADYDGTGGEAVQVTIEQNSTLTEIGNSLVDVDVVKSTKAFVNAADANPKGKNIQSGTYNMKKQMSAESAVTLLLDPKARVTKGVTFREGLTMMQTFELLSKATKIPEDDFVQAAKDPVGLGVPDYFFNRRDGKAAKKTVEGFLFPDTYEFDPKMDAQAILEVMVGRFVDTVTELGFVDTVQKNLSVSPFEALIVASLAEAESGVAKDLPKIARVAYNRTYKQEPAMPLQFDVTANYWLQLKGSAAKHSGQLSPQELNDPKNPYNSVSQSGLPPGPIDNPGKAALEGAMKPASGPWLFFVAVDKAGNSAFAVTDAEHEKNITKACANGIDLNCKNRK